MILIFKILLPIFAIIFIGFYSGKKKFINKNISKELGDLIMNISLPALLLTSTSKIKAEVLFNAQVLLGFAICLIIIYLATYFIYRFSLKKIIE